MAIEPLRSALAQMAVRASKGSVEVANAALAFAYVQASETAMAREQLAKTKLESGEVLAWSEKWVVEFCTSMARRWLGDPRGKEQLISAAAREAQHGRFTTAGISLYGATIPGTNDEFALLETISQKRQGNLAQIAELTGRGCRTRSAQLLMQAADVAAQLNLDAVESRCVRFALEFAERDGDSNMLATLRARANHLEADVPGLPVPSTLATKILTSREREVVRLAANGLANREIATELGVTIRTVEGHLYQAFAKLHVTTRGELNRLL
ncbi:MAG: hypothetical protein HIU81_09640 [Acidobacteria bacterium]|nr:hypothetical protein [Acidobacteriota bacterium]